MKNWGNLITLTNKVDGFLTEKEGKALFSAAEHCKGHGVIVEIGSWKGKSTIWLGKGSESGNKLPVYAIDPHTGSAEHHQNKKRVWTFTEFKKNIVHAHLQSLVYPIVSFSDKAAQSCDKPIEFLFIDGDHRYDAVKKDFQLWFPKVVDHGYIALHDTIQWSGPRRVANNFIFRSPYFRNVIWVDSLIIAEKVKQNSLSDRLKNYLLLFKRQIYFLGSRISLPLSVKKRLRSLFY